LLVALEVEPLAAETGNSVRWLEFLAGDWRLIAALIPLADSRRTHTGVKTTT
jgi:hypothetical protein